jgi:hypothetical protein
VFLGVPSTQKYPGTTYYPGQCVPHLFMFTGTCVRAVREGLNRMYPGTGSVHWHVCMYGHLYTVYTNKINTLYILRVFLPRTLVQRLLPGISCGTNKK